MANVKFNVNLNKLKGSVLDVKKAAERGMNDVVDDLIRTSSETAPHDHGVLEKSHSKDIQWTNGKIVGTVDYSVKEANKDGSHFNYALWTHESEYNLGPGSLAKPGGTGMSGKHYDVGNKYLTRPLEGEAETYRDHIADEIRKELR